MSVGSPPRQRPDARRQPPPGRAGRARTRRGRRAYRPIAVLAAVAVPAAVAGPLLSLVLDSEEAHRMSARSATLPTTPDSEPVSYQVTYETAVGDDVSTEILSVHRPFESRLEVRKGRPPGGAVTSLRVSRFGALETKSPTASSLHLTVPPTIAASDLRLRAGLTQSLREGRALDLGDDVVKGRPCRRYVVGGPVASGSLIPYVAGGPERAEVCVDARGILLEERWVKDGRLLRQRRAVAVEEFDWSDDTFSIGNELPRAEFDGAVTHVTDTSRLPLGSWELAEPIEGFSRLGRWTSISPRLGSANDNAFDPDEGRQASLHEVWTRGIDVVFIEQGSLLGEGGPLPSHPQARPIGLGALGAGEAIVDLRLNEARANVPGFGFVRVAGTVPLDDVISIARRLVPRSGGSLTPRSPAKTKDTP
jgi:hypothetical protein